MERLFVARPLDLRARGGVSGSEALTVSLLGGTDAAKAGFGVLVRYLLVPNWNAWCLVSPGA
jgi:hypothetical protein